jgi:SOS response regulatory protein OraA/RecX
MQLKSLDNQLRVQHTQLTVGGKFEKFKNTCIRILNNHGHSEYELARRGHNGPIPFVEEQ